MSLYPGGAEMGYARVAARNPGRCSVPPEREKNTELPGIWLEEVAVVSDIENKEARGPQPFGLAQTAAMSRIVPQDADQKGGSDRWKQIGRAHV